ncbi:hypothetical protein SAMN04487866_10894 [Thermoactinomyces sp. DSM 45891]|uniref:hypothetical protein n=1 Tax=Thermoactinomyces sp. DSM 45891 TaxID=1761907 RepID=UPI000922CE60|nr:hypothetical protein [Thermoactinomyces sp. DSM 45891]SFX46015.1 hypothetical protein SAMN04487866_10894 [Thermoactinomyces sp. DSM 45891]
MSDQLKDFIGIVFRIVKWMVTGVILIFVPFLVVWLGSMWIEGLLFHNSTDLYFYYRSPTGNIVTILLALLIMGLIVTAIPTREQKRSGQSRNKKYKRKVGIYLAVCLLLSIWDTTTHVSVNQSGINVASLFGIQTEQYKWTDIKEVYAGFRSNESNGFHPEYYVTFQDGEKIDLWSWSLSNKIQQKETDGFITANRLERAKAILYMNEQIKQNIPERLKPGKCLTKKAKEEIEKMYSDAKVESSVLELYTLCPGKL